MKHINNGLLALLLAGATILSGCDGESGKDMHQDNTTNLHVTSIPEDESKVPETSECSHEYGDWIIEKNASCAEEGLQVKICTKCSEKIEETISINTYAHKMKGDVCIFCNMQASRGLEYKLSSDGKYYIIIGIGSFKGNDLIFPESINGIPVTHIGREAFTHCKKITSIYIPEGITDIESEAFQECTKLTSVVIPNSAVNLGSAIFRNCSNLTAITLPANIDEITAQLLLGCDAMTELVIPEGVTKISFRAFGECINLKTVVIPVSVTEIGESVFCFCDQLQDVIFQGTQSQWMAINKASNWDDYSSDFTIHCTDGDIIR